MVVFAVIKNGNRVRQARLSLMTKVKSVTGEDIKKRPSKKDGL
jgi:hypothetical protein